MQPEGFAPYILESPRDDLFLRFGPLDAVWRQRFSAGDSIACCRGCRRVFFAEDWAERDYSCPICNARELLDFQQGEDAAQPPAAPPPRLNFPDLELFDAVPAPRARDPTLRVLRPVPRRSPAPAEHWLKGLCGAAWFVAGLTAVMAILKFVTLNLVPFAERSLSP